MSWWFSGMKPWLWALIFALVVSFGAAVYYHYTGLLEDVSSLREDRAELQNSLQIQQETLETQQQVIEEWQDAVDDLYETFEETVRVANEAASETRRLNDIFSNHDLGELARERPGLIERRVNDGTNDFNRMFECATGAADDDCDDRSRPAGPDSPGAEPATD